MRQIVNSKKVDFDGITFQSMMEFNCYKELKANNIEFKYEPFSYLLVPKFRANNIVKFLKISGKRDIPRNEIVRDISYTPDFVIEMDDKVIIIEVKGRANERYPLVRKMFLNLISRDKARRYYFFEPHNNKEIVVTVNLIKSIMANDIKSIKMSLSIVEDGLKKKDFVLLNKFIDERHFEESIELVDSIIRVKSSKRDKDDGDSADIANLTMLKLEITKYYEQIVPDREEEEWE